MLKTALRRGSLGLATVTTACFGFSGIAGASSIGTTGPHSVNFINQYPKHNYNLYSYNGENEKEHDYKDNDNYKDYDYKDNDKYVRKSDCYQGSDWWYQWYSKSRHYPCDYNSYAQWYNVLYSHKYLAKDYQKNYIHKPVVYYSNYEKDKDYHSRPVYIPVVTKHDSDSCHPQKEQVYNTHKNTYSPAHYTAPAKTYVSYATDKHDYKDYKDDKDHGDYKSYPAQHYTAPATYTRSAYSQPATYHDNEGYDGSHLATTRYSSSRNTTTIDTTNTVSVANNNPQYARSGNVYVANNTVADDVSSGDATNYSTASFNIDIHN